MNTNYWLEKIVKAIDLTPNDIQEAESTKNGLQNYLDYKPYKVNTYIQGSFSYGTAIKPIAKDVDGDFDLDLVCEVNNNFSTPKDLKIYIGTILEQSHYKAFLEPEGKRCWTLDYEKFHIDLLPSVHDNHKGGTFINLTHKDKLNERYTFKSSNPKGLAKWFLDINKTYYNNSINNLKSKVYEENKHFFTESLKYSKWQDVSESFISTPLQNAIKLMKRHRDIVFLNHELADYKPISVIITVLTGLTTKDMNVQNISIAEILNGLIINYSKFISKSGNKWLITNPVDSLENLADRWHEDNEYRRKAFLYWINQLDEFTKKLYNIDDSNAMNFIKEFFGKDTHNKVVSIRDKEKNISLSNPTSKPWNKHV